MSGSGASLQVSIPLRDLIEERRRVTVLFADVSGSVAMASTRDPEETREILRSCLTALARRVQRYGGTVDKYVGDAVMAVFGAPTSHEDDTDRAMHAALAMREAIGELNNDLRPRHGVSLSIRIGVNTGDVVAGVIAGDVQAAYTVVGDTVNIAQRLQNAARPGDIVVGASAYARARAFTFESLDPVQVKGKERPLSVYRLVGATAGGARDRVAQHRISSALVGRDPELAALVSLVRRLEDGHGGIVGIIGEPGAGKSRLLSELKRETSGMTVTWLEGRCFALGETTRYAPFVEVLARVAGIEDGDDDTRRWAKLEARVRAVVPHDDVEETLPYLAALLAIAPPAPLAAKLAPLSGEAMGRQIFRAMRRFLGTLARARPLVLAFEDLHWADASTAALLQHVLRATADSPLLLIGTGRPERATPAADLRAYVRALPRYTEIALGPLPDADAEVLVRNLLAVDDLPEDVRDLVLRRAEGNPLYMEEIVRSLVDSKMVVRDESSGRWRAGANAARIDLPDTIGGLIVARLDRLDERAKPALRHAAVIGRSFRESVLRALLPGTELDAGLAILLEEQIVAVRRQATDPEYMFRHVLIRETVYGSILRSERRELHARVARAIERIAADHVNEVTGVLAYHYARAELWEQALVYLERAGDQAGDVAADAEAVERYREAMAAYETTGRASAVQIASLERKLGEALFRRGEHGQATLTLRGALARLGASLPRSRGATTRGIAREVLVQAAHLAFPWRLPKPPRDADRQVQERTLLYQLLGWISYYGAESRQQLLVTLRMLNLGERVGHLPAINSGLLGTVIACDVLGLKGLAGRYAWRNLALAEAAGDPVLLGYANFALAYHLHGVGRWDEAEDRWARGAEAFWITRDLRRWGVSQYGVASMRWRRGEQAETQRIARRMLEVADENADPALRGWGLVVLGRAQWTTGDDARALASLREAAAILRDVPDRQILVRALADAGYVQLRRGDLLSATAALEEVAQLIATHEVRGFHSHALYWLLEAYLEHLERASAGDRDRWDAKVRSQIAVVRRQSRIDAETAPGLHRLVGRYHWLCGETARATAEWEASLAAATALNFVPELAWTHAEMGWWLSDADHLEKARMIAESMGAPGELARINATRMAAARR